MFTVRMLLLKDLVKDTFGQICELLVPKGWSSASNVTASIADRHRLDVNVAFVACQSVAAASMYAPVPLPDEGDGLTKKV